MGGVGGRVLDDARAAGVADLLVPAVQRTTWLTRALGAIERVGNAITTRLESEGKSGAVSRLGFTAWWNGGMRTVPYFHNMVGILTETALFRYATPNFYGPESLPDSFRDGTSTRDPSMNYPMPWPGGWWRLRDIVEGDARGLCGVDAAEVTLITRGGRIGVASRFVDGLKRSKATLANGKTAGVADGFMTDAWLTNTEMAPAMKNAGTRHSSTCSRA